MILQNMHVASELIANRNGVGLLSHNRHAALSPVPTAPVFAVFDVLKQ